VGLVIMGVSYKLIPMFTLSHGYKLTAGKISLVLINIGLLGINWIMHYPDTAFYNLIFGSFVFAGILVYLFQIFTIFKKRIRKKLDVGLKFSALSFIMMFCVTMFNFSFLFYDYESITNLTLVYGLLVLEGVFGLLIVGQMYKIVPFLVWYHKYSSKVGLENVPMLKDMFNENLAEYQMYLMFAGIIISVLGLILKLNLLVMTGFALLFVSSLIFVFNMYKIFRS
jgi:hypothetical protein